MTNRKSQAANRSVSIPITLSDLVETRDVSVRGLIFVADLHNYARMA